MLRTTCHSTTTLITIMTMMVNREILMLSLTSGIMPVMTQEPKKPKTHLVQVNFSPTLLKMLDELRQLDGGLPSRSDVIRNLIEREHARKTRKA